MKLDGYYFVDQAKMPLLDYKTAEKKRLVGTVTGRQGFPDGSLITTSRVESFDEEGKIAKTFSGSEYELGEMNQDYREMLDAHENGTPILFYWELKDEHFFSGDKYRELEKTSVSLYEAVMGSYHDGKELNGTTEDGERVFGEVIRQNGNYVTLVVDHEEKEFFVCWACYDDFWMQTVAVMGGELNGFKLDGLEECFGINCRPRICA